MCMHVFDIMSKRQLYCKRKSLSLSIFVEIYKKDNSVDCKKLEFPYTQYTT